MHTEQHSKQKKRKGFDEEVVLPEGVTVQISGLKVTIQGKKGTLNRTFKVPNVKIRSQNGKIILTALKNSQREKRAIGTITAHLQNMVTGVVNGHEYKLKICSGHFPMNVVVSGTEFSIKNFLGEKYPRKLTIKQGVTVKVQGTEVVVDSTDKELAGQTAASIEILTRIKGRDRRIYQDGIYIINKDGKVME